MNQKNNYFNFLQILNNESGNFDMIIVTNTEGTIELYNNFLSQLCNSANKDEILLQKIKINQLFKLEKETFEQLFSNLDELGYYEGDINFTLSYNQLIPFFVKAFKVDGEFNERYRYVFLFKLKEISEIERDPLEQKSIVKQKDLGITNRSGNELTTSIEELERLKEDFLSSVSHELRTPLASIIGFAETLKSDPELPKELAAEFLDIILNESKRLAATINDLLDVSQLYKDELKLQKTNVNLNDLLLKAYEQYKPIATEIEFTCKVREKPIFIHADENKLQQAINNLVSNAIKFTPEEGKVLINLYESELYYVIEVKDTGLGIPKKDIDKIFDRFYRVERPGLEIRGIGLGLSITKKILELHNFKIEVESEENKGSTFKILIPKES